MQSAYCLAPAEVAGCLHTKKSLISQNTKKCEGRTITLHIMTRQDSNLQSLTVIKRLYRYHVADIIVKTWQR